MNKDQITPMKKLHILTVAVVALVLGGCSMVLEDNSNCPNPLAHNLTFRFSNVDDNGNEIFASSIDKVEVFLFDDADHLVYRFEAPTAELAASKSVSYHVEPGTYRVICWGNAKEKTAIMMNPGDHISNGHIFKQTAAGEVVSNGNPLYHAPFDNTTAQRFTVVEGVDKEVDVRFRAAHIKMDFTVKGYADVTGETENPYIELTNLFPRYDFTMGYLPTAALNYIQQTGTTTRAADETYAYFNTPRFEKANPIVINLRRTATEAPLRSIILANELASRGLDPANIVELTIPFVLEFVRNNSGDIDIKISIAGWNPNIIDPGAN